MMIEQAWLTCSVSPGQFPTEFAIAGSQFNGKPFSLFAPADTVQPPARGEEGPGAVLVEIIERKKDLVLVRLPAQTFENGQFVTVPNAELSPHKIPAEAGA